MTNKRWKTIGISVPADLPIGGKEFVEKLRKYFNLLWDAAPDAVIDEITKDEHFQDVLKVIR